MRRDFSQPFNKSIATKFHLLIEDELSGEVLLLRSADADEENNGYYSEEFFLIPQLTLKRSDDVLTEVAKLLSQLGLSLLSIRELARVTEVSYSFVDDTPGTTQDIVCLHVVGHRSGPNPTKNSLVINEPYYTPLHTVLTLLRESSSANQAIESGIALLQINK